MVRISVIIPVFNASKFIGRCIKSFKNQIFNDYELIFIDDASTDNSVEIINVFRSEDKRIILLKNEINSGPMEARRKGYEYARGNYLFFCDSDDTLPEYALEKLYKNAVTTNADIVVGDIELQYPNGKVLIWNNYLRYGTNRISGLKSLLRGEVRHNVCAKLYKSSLFKDYVYDSQTNMNYFEDYLLMMQCAFNAHSYSNIGDIIYTYYQEENSSTHQLYSDWRMECNFIARRKVYDLFKSETDLLKDLNSNCQHGIARVMACGYNVDNLISKYGFSEVMSLMTIISSNSLLEAIKIFIQCRLVSFFHKKGLTK